jgi:hypothetical protein
MVLSKQLSVNAQESLRSTEDEQKVNELQNQPLQLAVMLRSEQLKEIEVWKHENHWQHDCIVYPVQYNIF